MRDLLYCLAPGRDNSALMDAVSNRWLVDIEADPQAIAQRKSPAVKKLREWFVRLHKRKLEKVKADAELYAAFDAAASDARPFMERHLSVMRAQLAGIVAEGMASGELARSNAAAAAEPLFVGTAAFHHPRFVLEHMHEDRVPQLRKVLNPLIAGMNVGASR